MFLRSTTRLKDGKIHYGELSFYLRKDKLREIRQREGRYLLRSNLGSENPAQLWQLYIL